MEGIIVPLGIGLLAVVAVAVLVAVLEHRKRINEMQRRLTWSEESRFAMEQHAEAMDARLAAIHAALRSQRRPDEASTPAPAPAPAPADSAAVSVDAAGPPATAPAQPPAGDLGWHDTEPMIGKSLNLRQQFADTMPADIEIELPATPASARRREPA